MFTAGSSGVGSSRSGATGPRMWRPSASGARSMPLGHSKAARFTMCGSCRAAATGIADARQTTKHVRHHAPSMGCIDPRLADLLEQPGRRSFRAPDRPPQRQRRRATGRARGWHRDPLAIHGDHCGLLPLVGRSAGPGRRNVECRRRVPGHPHVLSFHRYAAGRLKRTPRRVAPRQVAPPATYLPEAGCLTSVLPRVAEKGVKPLVGSRWSLSRKPSAFSSRSKKASSISSTSMHTASALRAETYRRAVRKIAF